MTYLEVFQMVSAIPTQQDAIPVAYYQFPDDPNHPAPAPPFMTYYYPESSDLHADNINFSHIRALTLELYCDNKDFALEQAVEAALTANGISFHKFEDYIESEKLYMTTYEAEVSING